MKSKVSALTELVSNEERHSIMLVSVTRNKEEVGQGKKSKNAESGGDLQF